MTPDNGTEELRWGSGSGNGSRHRPLEVKVDGRGVESAIRLFKKLVLRDGILKELKRRSHYEKPGEKRRRKVREAARRLRRQAARAVRREQREF
jgi:small subunit ribosomal protein S21